jgi:hypothetical protein
MSAPGAKEALRQLCEKAADVVAQAGIEPSSYRGLSPFNDTSRNAPFLALPNFVPATEALHHVPDFDSRVGPATADNFALQFVFNFLGRLPNAAFDQAAFEEVWNELTSELADPNWTYFSICNLKNFTCADESVVLGDGVLIRSRNYSVLSALLGKDENYIDATLGRDWMEGGTGSHVMIVETRLAKHPDNLVLGNDPESLGKLSRALLAMRLSKSGFVSPGRIFFIRKAMFRFGLGGITSTGQSRRDFSTSYELTSADVALIQGAYTALKTLEGMGDKTRALSLALRVFSSIYERDHFRADDRLVDSVTAIEAALRLDTDLSFRSSFQVAGLLAGSDDDRATIFRDMKTFYDTRSKVVHGGELKPKHTAALQGYERLVDLVRRLLSGFVTATASGAIPQGFYEEIDASLQHSVRRAAIRAAFGWT